MFGHRAKSSGLRVWLAMGVIGNVNDNVNNKEKI